MTKRDDGKGNKVGGEGVGVKERRTPSVRTSKNHPYLEPSPFPSGKSLVDDTRSVDGPVEVQ